MGLSITGNFLTGPWVRSDITRKEDFRKDNVTVATPSDLADGDMRLTTVTHTFEGTGPEPHWLNICGMIPGVSTITGVGRSLVGLVHMVAHLAKAIFDKPNRDEHLREAGLGFYNLVRGLVEAVPVAGNIVVIVFDVYRLNKEQKKFVEGTRTRVAKAIAQANDQVNL